MRIFQNLLRTLVKGVRNDITNWILETVRQFWRQILSRYLPIWVVALVVNSGIGVIRRDLPENCGFLGRKRQDELFSENRDRKVS